MLCNLAFANNTILPCFFSFCLTNDLHFLISEIIAQILSSTAELPMSIEYQLNEAKAKMETHPLSDIV